MRSSIMTTPARPPILLTMADYYGTLAAVRSLGRLGVPITVAESKLLAPARWSRYVTRRVGCPDVSDSEAFLE
jgi:predicted ATP-grasp superfamily ATP-dependent carboligase